MFPVLKPILPQLQMLWELVLTNEVCTSLLLEGVVIPCASVPASSSRLNALFSPHPMTE